MTPDNTSYSTTTYSSSQSSQEEEPTPVPEKQKEEEEAAQLGRRRSSQRDIKVEDVVGSKETAAAPSIHVTFSRKTSCGRY